METDKERKERRLGLPPAYQGPPVVYAVQYDTVFN